MFTINAAHRSSRPPVAIDFAKFEADRARSLKAAAAVKPSISRLLGVPVSVPLGGGRAVVAELTLGDVSALQAWLGGALYGTPAAALALDAPLGRVKLLEVLAAHHQQPPSDPLPALALAATADEWAALERVAYGVTARMEEVARRTPREASSPGIDWEAWLWMLRKAHGIGFREARTLSLTEVRFLLAGGKLPESTSEFLERSRRMVDPGEPSR